MNTDLGLLFLRVTTGFLILTHGWGKVAKLVSGDFSFPDPLGIGGAPSLFLAAAAEFGCALLVIAGVKVRWAAIPLVITMLVAAFGHHAADPWAKKEFPLLYAVVFAALILTGPGRHTLPALLKKSE